MMLLFSGIAFIATLVLVCTVLLYKPEIKLPENAVLVLAPRGDIVEQRSPIDPMAQVFNNLAGIPMEQNVFLQDILDCIYGAADNADIQAMLIDTDQLGRASLDQIQAIGRAIKYFQESGKKVIAAADQFNQIQYYLASWADEIFINPMGGVHLRGFGLSRIYARELFEKMDMDFHVFKVGTFKSAVEPFTRNDMSPAAKQATKQWLDALWDVYSSDIAENRRLSTSSFKRLVDEYPAKLLENQGDRSTTALAAKLVDGIKDHQEVVSYMAELVGAPEKMDSFPQVSHTKFLQTLIPSYSNRQGKHSFVGIITASGNILYGNGAVNQIGSRQLINTIRRATRDRSIKALVLRITTGGGSAFASELIRQELLNFQQTGKPLVISMGAMAASGGYWLSANADAIFAAPTTLTGSIGIFGAIPTIDKSLAKIGLHGDSVGTGPTALFGNPTTPMTEQEKSYHQLSVAHGYNQFLSIVAEGREMDMTKVKMIADGRVWDGKAAQRLGLVDQLGDLENAIAEAAKLAGMEEEDAVYIAPRLNPLLDAFKQMGNYIGETLDKRLASRFLPNPLQSMLTDKLGVPGFTTDPNCLYAHSLLPETPATFLSENR